jgi:serine protease inhibitor
VYNQVKIAFNISGMEELVTGTIEAEVAMNVIPIRIILPVLFSTTLLLTGGHASGGRDPDAARMVSSYNNLGISLYNLVAAENEGCNIFISPISISVALAMTHNGASGGTAEEMDNVLGLEGWSQEKMNETNGKLLERLGEQMEGITLDIANSIWCRDGLRFDPLFLERTSDYFGAEAHSLDFTSPEAKDIINGWVSEHTEGMIDGIIDEIDPLSILFLINAVYFRGEWRKEFDPEETREQEFNLASGGVKRVQMMHQSGTYRYRRGEDYQAVSLPYGDGRMSMYLFLPDSSSSLEDFHRPSRGIDWDVCMKHFSSSKGSIAVPRFRAEFETGLENLLEPLGMVKAFRRKEADFSGMMSSVPEEVWIDEILHKAVVEVTEKGTEAAAATSVVIVAASISTEEPFVMVFDRPFFFAITDNETGMILFMGSIADPERPERAW